MSPLPAGSSTSLTGNGGFEVSTRAVVIFWSMWLLFVGRDGCCCLASLMLDCWLPVAQMFCVGSIFLLQSATWLNNEQKQCTSQQYRFCARSRGACWPVLLLAVLARPIGRQTVPPPEHPTSSSLNPEPLYSNCNKEPQK